MIPFLFAACALVADRPVKDSNDAFARAKRLVSAAGVHEAMIPGPVTKRDKSYLSNGTCWWVSLKTESGGLDVVLDARTGRVLHIVHPRLPYRLKPYPVSRITSPTPAHQRRALAILRAVGYDADVKLSPQVGDGGYHFGYHFYKTAHNLMFFNSNPTYAHTVHVNKATKALEYFMPSAEVPKVSAWKPDVQPGVARARIAQWAKTHERQPKIDMTPFGFSEEIKPELGYYKLKTEAQARLVWRGVKYRKSPARVTSGDAIDVFVDALSGALIEPDDKN